MKKVTTKKLSNEGVEKLRKKEEAKALRQQLILGPDYLIQKKGTDKELDKRIEKIELLNGEQIDVKQLFRYIDNKINEYAKKFSQQYYREIFRLNGWQIPKSGIISKKPSIVGKYTINIIYGRFPKEVLPVIEGNNRYTEIGIRLYKHFQFLTPEGVKQLEEFIEQSVKIMKRCNHWDEFVTEHAKAYGHPFQISLFE